MCIIEEIDGKLIKSNLTALLTKYHNYITINKNVICLYSLEKNIIIFLWNNSDYKLFKIYL